MLGERGTLLAGVRAGLPFALPTFVLGISFGVLARPVMGPVAPIVMSALMYAGAGQFAALSVLAAGGGAGIAVVAGLLMNARWLPMSLAIGPSLPGRALRRVAFGQAIVDASWALSSRGDGTFDRAVLVGATLPQAAAWTAGTIAGVVGARALGQPERLGLDAIFPAFYLSLLFREVRDRRALLVAGGGAAITMALLPVTPSGLPILAASAAALVGLRRA
jgi:predicted branched-subunit amino acid permease